MQQLDSYNSKIFIGEDIFPHFEKILREQFFQASKVFVLVDSQTLQFCLPVLIKNIPFLNQAEILEVDSGEDSKSFEILSGLIEALAALNTDKNTLLTNLGGGVVCDLGGMLASLYKRGIKYINVPTSLLAMADASIGGKVAVNVGNIKNIAGLFNPPDFIFVNPIFLKTLDEKQFLSGFAEILKHALIDDRSHWIYLQNINLFFCDNWTEILFKSISIKNNIVKNDPHEKNIRKLLNLGHTIGHGIESCMLEKGNFITHGEAVAAGILIESYISLKQGLLNEADFISVKNGITKFYEKIDLKESDIEKIINYLFNDKKNENEEISFVLLSAIGNAHINKTASIEEIKAAIQFYISIN
jgi:3-dehydroquinate synthase